MGVNKKKNIKKDEKAILTITILSIFLLFLGGLRIFLTFTNVRINSRVKDIAKLQKTLKDNKVSGWLKIPGTDIDYPILEDYDKITYEQDKDMQYLWQNGEMNKLNKLNFVLGHNIMNLSANPLIRNKDHVRFEQLMSFTYLDFAKKNQYVQFTIDGQDYLFKIFSVRYSDRYDVVDFNKEDYTTKYVKNYIDKALKESIYKYDIDISEKDNIISLITCTRMYGSNKEFVVDARLMRNGESTRNYKVTKSKKYDEVEKIMKGEKENDSTM